jgi:hypothetical protein
MTYINLPSDKINNMIGGAIIDPNNPYLVMGEDELNQQLFAHSTIYLYMYNLYIVGNASKIELKSIPRV